MWDVPLVRYTFLYNNSFMSGTITFFLKRFMRTNRLRYWRPHVKGWYIAWILAAYSEPIFTTTSFSIIGSSLKVSRKRMKYYLILIFFLVTTLKILRPGWLIKCMWVNSMLIWICWKNSQVRYFTLVKWIHDC